MPCGLFVAVNNHFQNIILAGMLMHDEQGDNSEWVFREFLHMMGGPAPNTILTDQNRAMVVVMKKVYPERRSTVVLKKAKDELQAELYRKRLSPRFIDKAQHQHSSTTTHTHAQVSTRQEVDRVNAEGTAQQALKSKKRHAHKGEPLNHMLTEDEFETAWGMLLDKYNLRNTFTRPLGG